jgi:hypothetical protein
MYYPKETGMLSEAAHWMIRCEVVQVLRTLIVT